MQIGRQGQVRQVREIVGRLKAETHARTLRVITATGRRLRHQMAVAATQIAGPRLGTARINRPLARVRLVTRTHRPTTIVEAAARTSRLRGLIRHRPAVTHRRRALTLRRRHLPTRRLRALTPLLAVAMEAEEAGVMEVVVEVEAALTAEAVVGDRTAAALTEAVLTDARMSGKKPAPNWGGLFCV